MSWSPPPFSLRQLQYALALAQDLSFRKAAERCHVSQPALSSQLAELEQALGARLFERDKKRVLLTSAGRELLARASRVLLEADALSESARRSADPLAGALRLGVIPTVSPYLLPPLTPRIRQKLPKLSIAWREEKTETVAALLEQGELDGGIVALESELGDVERETIAKDEFVLVTPPKHPLSRHGAAAAIELRDQSVLLLDDGHCFREQALAFCSKAKAHELEFRATSLSTLVQMVAGGAGVTLLPSLAVPTETQRAKLAVRRFVSPPARTLALVFRPSCPVKPALQQIAALAKESYAEAAL
ncbi:MAG: LysR family transcriptional regulator [Myxococcales bacterium]|nr:MAG: LysR family transcriptional regulator [Myxococcales bacterium]